MLKQTIYGAMGLALGGLFVGNLLVQTPETYTIQSHAVRPLEDDADRYQAGEYAVPLFDTYHATGEHIEQMQEQGKWAVGRNNPMYYWTYIVEPEDEDGGDSDERPTFSWAEYERNLELPEGESLGFDSNVTNPTEDAQLKVVETLTINERFETYGVLPVDEEYYNITSGFGLRTDPISGRQEVFHGGLDIASYGINGKPIYSVLPGTVAKVDTNPEGYGHYIVINHDDFTSLYAHLKEPSSLEVGESVEAGDIIGEVGSTGRSTGPHLHLEIDMDGLKLDPYQLLALTLTEKDR